MTRNIPYLPVRPLHAVAALAAATLLPSCGSDGDPARPDAAIAAFSVGGTIVNPGTTPLRLAMLDQVLEVPAGASSFTFDVPVPTGTTLEVTIDRLPDDRACTIRNARSTMGDAPITDVEVGCVSSGRLIGTINYFEGPLVISNGADQLELVNGDRVFDFGERDYGSNLNLQIVQPSPTSQCQVIDGAGTFLPRAAPPRIDCVTQYNFAYTGAGQAFGFGEPVDEVTFDAFGAQGGDASGGALGGLGGNARGTLRDVPAGTTFFVYVGAQGGQGAPDAYGGGAAAYNGAGNGGGASDVRIGAANLSSRILVAGGGGGAGQSACLDSPVTIGGNGGAGGGGAGENGSSIDLGDPAAEVTGGTGAPAPDLDAGLGGVAGFGCANTSGIDGAAAIPGLGGGGGFGPACCCSAGNNRVPSGGGGGGGYVGGGGGGGGTSGNTMCSGTGKSAGGGGAGGLSWVGTLEDPFVENGVRTGNGAVFVTIK